MQDKRPIRIRVSRVSDSWQAVAPDLDLPTRFVESARTIAILRRKVSRGLAELLDGQELDIDYEYVLPDRVRPAVNRLRRLRQQHAKIQAAITPTTREAFDELMSLGMTHDDAAAILGRSPQRISQIKAGTRR